METNDSALRKGKGQMGCGCCELTPNTRDVDWSTLWKSNEISLVSHHDYCWQASSICSIDIKLPKDGEDISDYLSSQNSLDLVLRPSLFIIISIIIIIFK